MEVKVNANEVSWIFGTKVNKGQQANSALASKLNEYAKYFVPMDVGTGYYSWCLPDDNWFTLSQLSGIDENKARDAHNVLLSNIKKDVPDSSFANIVLTVPNEDYIYVRFTEEGEAEILFTCWGFKSYNNAKPGPLKEEIERKFLQSVSVAFKFDGELLPTREFLSRFSYQQLPNSFITADNGFFRYDKEIKIGEPIEIKDKLSNKYFNLLVEKGRSDYVFDITDYSSVHVYAKRDGEPMRGALVKLEYNGKEYSVNTDMAGKATLELPYREGEVIVASIEDERQEKLIDTADNIFEFEFLTPVLRSSVKVTVFQDDVLLIDEPVQVRVNGAEIRMQTNTHGEAVYETDYFEGSYIDVVVRGVQKHQQMLEGENIFEYKFVIPKERIVNIKFDNLEGVDFVGKEVSLKQGDKKLYFVLDDDNSFDFNRNELTSNEEVLVSVAMEGGERLEVSFVLDADEDNYLLVGELVKKKSNIWIAELIVAAVLLAAAVMLADPFVDAATELGNTIINS